MTAAGGLVGEVVQIWKPKEINTFETEWGFSAWVMRFLVLLNKMAKQIKCNCLLEMDHIFYKIVILQLNYV